MTDYEFAERTTNLLAELPARMRDTVYEIARKKAFNHVTKVAPKGKILKALKELVTPFARIIKEHEAAVAANKAKKAKKA